VIDETIRAIVREAIAEAHAPLLDEIRQLRAVVAASGAKWVSRRDAAEALGVSLDSIDRRCADRSLQSRKVGRSVRVMLEPLATDGEIVAMAQKATGQ